MKILLHIGKFPYPEFIGRQISELKNDKMDVTCLGVNTDSKSIDSKSIYYNLYSPFRFSKFTHISKWFMLMMIFKFREWKHYHFVLKKTFSLKNIVFDYPILFERPDILHIQWAKSIHNFQWVQEFGIKLVVSLRGAHINYSPLADEQLAAVYRKAFPKVDAFHGVSQAICREAAHYGADASKCKVVYSGFDLRQFPQPSPRASRGTKPLKIVSVGRAHWKKGYHYALDAMLRLKEAGVAFTYHIVGVGQDEELAFQLDQLQLTDCVQFGSKLPFSEVLNTVRCADVFLLPSVEEGIANVVIEAMLLGTPVITTNCGGMEELVEDGANGLVVPVRDPQAITEAILRFSQLTAEEFNDMQMAAYSKACSQHNTQKMVDGMQRVYSLALHGNA